MARADWTPVVLIASTVSLTVVTVVLFTSPVFRPTYEATPGPARPRHALPDRVAVWVGDLGDGLQALLSPVWGDEPSDLDHDRTLNEGLAAATPLAFYDLVLFNTSSETRRLVLADGAIQVLPAGAGDGQAVPLLSVEGLVGRGEASPSPALQMVLLGRGTLRREVEVEPDAMVNLLVAFARRVDLDTAEAVKTADGQAFRRRPMARRELEALLLQPSEKGLENL